MIGKLVTLDERENRFDTLPRVDVAEGLETRGFHGVFQDRADLNGHSGRAVTDDYAPQKPRVVRGREQQRRRPDVGADCVRMLEPELLDDLSDEFTHCRRREQFVPPLRVPEPRQVNRHEVCVLGESGPHLLEREEALRPRAQENSRYVAGVAFGISDRQAINLSDLGCL